MPPIKNGELCEFSELPRRNKLNGELCEFSEHPRWNKLNGELCEFSEHPCWNIQNGELRHFSEQHIRNYSAIFKVLALSLLTSLTKWRGQSTSQAYFLKQTHCFLFIKHVRSDVVAFTLQLDKRWEKRFLLKFGLLKKYDFNNYHAIKNWAPRHPRSFTPLENTQFSATYNTEIQPLKFCAALLTRLEATKSSTILLTYLNLWIKNQNSKIKEQTPPQKVKV